MPHNQGPQDSLLPKKSSWLCSKGPQESLTFTLLALHPPRASCSHVLQGGSVCLPCKTLRSPFSVPSSLSLPYSLLYSGHTNAHALVCEGPGCPDCIQWISAEVQKELEPQTLCATNAKGLGLVLSLGNFSQTEVLVHQGMEKKEKEKPQSWEPRETCHLSRVPTKKL